MKCEENYMKESKLQVWKSLGIKIGERKVEF